jgi:hypothetical protein
MGLRTPKTLTANVDAALCCVPQQQVTLPERVFNAEYARQTLPRALHIPDN